MADILAIDIGGSHIASGLFQGDDRLPGEGGVYRLPLAPGIGAGEFLDVLTKVISHQQQRSRTGIAGAGVAVPGPFEYGQGVSRISGVGKLERIFGLDLRQHISALTDLGDPAAVRFINDAEAMLAGHIRMQKMTGRILGVTLGTGFGSAFFEDGKVCRSGRGIPPGGMLYDQPFEGGIADEAFSSRWFTREYARMTGKSVAGVRELAERAAEDPNIGSIFNSFGGRLASFLAPCLERSGSDTLLVGGNLAKARGHFMEELEKGLRSAGQVTRIEFIHDGELAALTGAAGTIREKDTGTGPGTPAGRKTGQHLLPRQKPKVENRGYDIYPAYPLPPGMIHGGFDGLAGYLSNAGTVVIDGYIGVDWRTFVRNLGKALDKKGIPARFFCIDAALRPVPEILELTKEAMGEEGSIFGRRYPGPLSDLFDPAKLRMIRPAGAGGIDIVYGCGAALAGWDGPLVYVDLPKNELQFRSRAGGVRNLGNVDPGDAKMQYKRFYFVDWVVLNRHKQALLPEIGLLADDQRSPEVSFIPGGAFRQALGSMAKNYFRVRPWFEPGPWGGQWMKDHIEGLPQDVPNYAWSFELIVPENGLLLESGGRLLECSFDFLMYANAREVLGHAHEAFGTEFPIRFDFLDTVEGGNLSVQCHPRPGYIKAHFGESFTQDETYYILEATEDAQVYLGFREDIDPVEFRKALEDSFVSKTEVDIPKYVQVHPSKKHDLFLIPGGTIHASGAGNLVLEISSTPYIFTFKMYDWLRLDLDGNPRPLNIGHAFRNLCFDRKGERVKQEFISRPELMESGEGYRIVRLPAHKDHFYDVRRVEFEEEVTLQTNDRFFVCMLVEGTQVLLRTDGAEASFNYAETFVIPAAAGTFQLINKGGGTARVVQAFVKDTFKI